MEILVIGSKGFIGNELCNFFLNKGYFVLGCDIYPSEGDLNYVYINPENPNYNPIFTKYKISHCINCSGSANVQLSMKEPFSDFKLNTVNVFNILDSIRKISPTTKFINLSSAAVYGNPISLPIKENSLLSPVSLYGMHKMQSEQICKQFYDFYNINVCSLRLFSAYGEGLKKQLFWDLYKKLDNKESIFLYGTGMERRDFIYIDDIVKVIDIVIEKGSFDAEIYNIGSGKSITISEVVRLFYNLFDEKIKFTFIDKKKVGDPLYWQADISKISELGFIQKVSIYDGLVRYTQWLKNSI